MIDFEVKINGFFEQARKVFNEIKNLDDLGDFYQKFLSKKSDLNDLLKNMKNLSDEEKKNIGPKLQNQKNKLIQDFELKTQEIEVREINEKLNKENFDPTKDFVQNFGTLHPITQVQQRIEEIFTSMGFMIADGPEVETEWHNFDALNIPGDHPARDMQDTFWISKKFDDSNKNLVLRTQTSNVQIRAMKKHGTPIRLIAPGRVFRNEAVDASHDATFYQVEGLMVDKNISLAHLKGTLEKMLSELFEKEVKIRIRPGYFPFVEPGLEVDFSCLLCSGQGCKTCKRTGWIEFMGAGMVHPNVLKNCEVDPEEFSGFAFGFGLTRLAMMKYGIDDIRLLFSNKKDFFKQF